MKNIISFIKSHVVIATGVVILAVAGTAIAGRLAASKASIKPSDSSTKLVTLVDASTFRTGLSTVSADGVVESLSQVDLKSQVSSPISSISTSIGANVYAGQTIVELENADIRAQLEQAKASLALALGQHSSSGVSLTNTKDSAIDKIRDSYVVSLQAINTNFEGRGSVIQLTRTLAEPQVYDKILNAYTDFNSSVEKWKESIDALNSNSSDSQILSTLTTSRNQLNLVASILDSTLSQLNKNSVNNPSSVQTTLDPWKTTATTARTLISASLSSLTAAEGSLTSAGTSNNTSSEAQIALAQAGVKNLEAQLAKTIIRSPITGKIAALPLRKGELASPGSFIATVVGSGGLQVKAYASGEDLARIKKNASAMVEGNIPGIVTSVAPSVNQTNRKVEVNITITSPVTSALVVGQSVEVAIDAGSKIGTDNAPVSYLLPIQNVKIIPGNAYVLSVDSDSKIHFNPIVMGDVKGEFIDIKSGLTDDMKIVSPVYELNEGEVVKVQ